MSLRTLQIKRDIHDQAEILQRIAQKPLTGVLDKWASLIHAYSISIRTAELPDEGAKMSNDQLMDIFMRNSKKYDLFESNMRKLTRAMKKFTKMIEVNGFASYVENVTTEISHLDGKEKTTALENAFENLCKEMNTL